MQRWGKWPVTSYVQQQEAKSVPLSFFQQLAKKEFANYKRSLTNAKKVAEAKASHPDSPLPYSVSLEVNKTTYRERRVVVSQEREMEFQG